MSYCRLPNDSSRVNRQDIEAKRKRILKNKKYRTTCLPASNTGWGWNGVALSRLFDTIANRIATINDERRVTSGKVSQVKSLLEDWQPKQNDACEKQKFPFFFWSKRILYIIYGTAILLPSGSSRGLPLKNLLLLLVTVYQRGDDDGIKRRHTYNNIRLLDTQTFSLSLYVAEENSAKFIIPEKDRIQYANALLAHFFGVTLTRCCCVHHLSSWIDSSQFDFNKNATGNERVPSDFVCTLSTSRWRHPQ